MERLTESGYVSQAKTKLLMEKWANRINAVETNLGESLGLEKKACLAKVLENTKSYLSEAVQSSDIGQFKRYALDIVSAIIPNSIAFDLVSVQPIENRVGMVNYIKYTYANTKGSTTAGTEFASSLNLGASDEKFTSVEVDGESVVITKDGTNKIVTGTLNWRPVKPRTVALTLGTLRITDNGEGVLVAASGLDTSDAANNVVDYATGNFKITLSAADSTNDLAVAQYEYNNEFVPTSDIPEIKAEIVSVPVAARTRRLKTIIGFEASFELKKEYGQDANDLLNAQAAAEIAREIDVEVCNDLFKGANAGEDITFSKSARTGVTVAEHYDAFLVKLEEGSAAIFQATRRYHANFVVLGTQAAVVAKSHSKFKDAESDGQIGPHFIGTLGGFKCYVNPEFAPNDFVMGYKGKNLLDAGYVYAPYMPIVSTDGIQLEDMATRKGYATMYAKCMLNSKLYIRGKVTA